MSLASNSINQLLKLDKKKLIKYCFGYLKHNNLLTEQELENLNKLQEENKTDEYNDIIIKKALKSYIEK